MTRLADWAIPGRVWAVLLSWGLAVLILAGLFGWWIRANQLQQDRDMCAMLAVLRGGPEPVAGPAGERSRAVRAAMDAYYAKRGCPPR